jgi:hypothetical protein
LSHILMSDEIAYRESGSGDDSDDESDADWAIHSKNVALMLIDFVK